MIVFKTHGVRSEADVNLAPEALARFGYRLDAPQELPEFREAAEKVVQGVQDDAERFRRLADYVYGLRRRGARQIVPGEYGYRLSDMFQKLRAGEWGNCGHTVWMMTALTRSLGYYSRQVVWFSPSGAASHSALEIFSSQYGERGRWVYYDTNLNGYGVGRNGQPLSIAALRSNLLTGEDIEFVVSKTHQDWDEKAFMEGIRAYPLDWYLMNNQLLYYERDRRFGPLNAAYSFLIRLPYPMDRLVDNVVGIRETRLAVEGQVGAGGLLTLRGLKAGFLYLGGMSFLCFAVAAFDRRRRRLRLHPAVVVTPDAPPPVSAPETEQ